MDKLFTNLMFWIGRLLGLIFAIGVVFIAVLILLELIDIMAMVLAQIIDKFGTKPLGG